jgi:DNA modification methylase
VYELGPHRLLCGDARDQDAISALCGERGVEVLWTDPPYGVDYEGKTRDRLRIENDHADAVAPLLTGVFAAVDPILAPCARLYLCAPAGALGVTYANAITATGWRLHQQLIWVKQSLVLGRSDYHYQHEQILYGYTAGPGRPGRGRHKGSRWFGDNRQTSVFFVDKPAASREHPTMKPVELVEAHLRNSSRRGDTVLDPFAGSGSTLIACERLGRRCLAVELDPAYCDVIRHRYAQFTGRAELAP